MPTLTKLWNRKEKVVPDRKKAQELVVDIYTNCGCPPAASRLAPLLEPEERKGYENAEFPYRKERGRWHGYRGYALGGVALAAQHFFGFLAGVSPVLLFVGVVVFVGLKDALVMVGEGLDSVTSRVRILQIRVARLDFAKQEHLRPLDLARAIHWLDGQGSDSTAEEENAWHLADKVLEKATYEPETIP